MASAIVVAPVRAGLDTLPSEAQEVVNVLSAAGWRVRLVQQPVTKLELFRAADEGEYELGWLGAHSGKDGFALDSEVVSPLEIGSFFAAAGCRDVVLNSCFSAEHVDAIQQVAPTCNIVATIRPEGIADQEAWSAALYLVRRFVRVGSLREAQRQGGTGQYRWFPAPSPGMSRAMDNEALRRLEMTTERLVRALQGDEFSRSPGLIASMLSLQDEMRAYVRADQEWKRKTEERIEAVEEIQAQGRTVTMQGTALFIWLTVVAVLIAVVAIATYVLSGG